MPAGCMVRKGMTVERGYLAADPVFAELRADSLYRDLSRSVGLAH